MNGPRALIGSAYLEIQDMPNFDPYLCQKDPGVKQLQGSTEKIIATLDVQNLLSVLDLDSIMTKIRSNRVADCLGSITVQFSPGLVFSDTLLPENSGDKNSEPLKKIKIWQNWKNQLKINRLKKLSIKDHNLKVSVNTDNQQTF